MNKSVYIGVCKTRDDPKFEDSYRRFTDSLGSNYGICLMTVRDTFLPDAQNIITKDFLQTGHDYLLLLDDDHWGHTKEMLDTLVGANTNVATMKTYSRHYPYVCAAWNKVGHGALVSIENGQDYQSCDLTGFPMTLISRETFDLLDPPYFRPLEAEGRKWNSDVDFFERLRSKGVRPIVCFQHCLNHDKITQDNVWDYRSQERLENNNLAWFQLLQQRQLQGV